MSGAGIVCQGSPDDRDRGEVEPGASSYRPTRSWIKFDRFALSDIGREHRLSDRALWALDTLCRLADRRIGVVNTTIHDLTDATRNARAKAISLLALPRL